MLGSTADPVHVPGQDPPGQTSKGAKGLEEFCCMGKTEAARNLASAVHLRKSFNSPENSVRTQIDVILDPPPPPAYSIIHF